MILDDEPIAASANGILNCLSLLADEAAALHLRHTLSAIQDALETARRECIGLGQELVTLH